MSLSDSNVTAVIAVGDMDRAKKFYMNVLGLRIAVETPDEVIMQCGECTQLQLYKSPTGAGGESGATLATWEVDDIDAEAAELRSRGVKFEDYDMPGFRTTKGIFTDENMKSAWFKDDSGNMLCLHQQLASGEAGEGSAM